MAEILVKCGGVHALLFAGFHLLFWRLFDWKSDLASLSFLNRAIVQVMNLCLVLVFVMFGSLSLLYAREMVGSALGTALVTFVALFWLARAVEQVVFFKLRHWASWAFFVVFVLGFGLYAGALLVD